MAIITALTGARSWSVPGDWSGGVIPAAGDSVVLPETCSMLMDYNYSAGAGLLSVTISNSSVSGNQAMLYFKSGTSGYLKIQTGESIKGTNAAYRGRLLANSDGIWGNTGDIAFANKAIIDLVLTAFINAQYLDIALRCTNPVLKSVRTYGVIKTVTSVDTTADTLTSVAHGLTDATAVMVTSSGTLPAPLLEDTVYYIYAKTNDTIKLVAYTGLTTPIDITSAGTGTIRFFTGVGTGVSGAINILDDVTADSAWNYDAGHNSAVLVSGGPQNYDQQRLTISAITPTTITLSAATDSAQYPGARVWLMSRNVSVRSSCTTSVNIIDYSSAPTVGGIFQCEIRSAAGAGTVFYGSALYYGTGHTMSGSISGCNNGLYYGTGHTVSGSISDCSIAFNYGTGHTVSGSISGCNTALFYGTGHTVSGSISGCNTALFYGTGHTMSGSISGCSAAFRFGVSDTAALTDIRLKSAQGGTLTFASRNVVGIGSQGLQAVYSEDHNRIPGAHRAWLTMGDLIKTQCNAAGTGNLPPSIAPDSTTTGYCIEASSIQTNCNTTAFLNVFNRHRIFLAAGTHTITYKIQSTFTATLTAAELSLRAEYTGASNIRTTVTSSETMAPRINGADWTKTLSVTFTSAFDGFVDLRLDLGKYEATGGCLYVWPIPVVA